MTTQANIAGLKKITDYGFSMVKNGVHVDKLSLSKKIKEFFMVIGMYCVLSFNYL